MIETLRELMVDESGNAIAEYALVASVIAFLTIGLMTTISTEASGQIATTDTGLNNRNGVTN